MATRSLARSPSSTASRTLSANLLVGVHTLNAYYNGDSTFAPNSSPVVSQLVTPVATGTDLVGNFVSTTLPSSFVAGEVSNVIFQITNQGNVAAKGSITNALFLSPYGTIGAGAIPLTLSGALAKANLNLAPGKSIQLTGTFTAPDTVQGNIFALALTVNSTQTLPESDFTNNTSASAIAYTAVKQFGLVAGRPKVVLSLEDSDGTVASFGLRGPGTGAATLGIGTVDISVIGATPATSLFINTKGGDGLFDLHNLSITGTIAAINAKAINLDGDLSLSAGANQIALATITNATMNLTGAVQALTFASLTNTNIAVPSIGTLHVLGNVTNCNILAGANFGPDGQLGGGDDTFAAGTINAIQIGGSVNSSLIAAGLDVVDDTFPLDGDDTLIPGGIIRQINIAVTLSDDSKILAAKLPKNATIGGKPVPTAGDPRFMI